MGPRIRLHAARSILYGGLVLGGLGYGCRGCSCADALSRMFPKPPPAERVFSDVEMLSEGSEPRVSLRVARWSGFRYRLTMEAQGSLGVEGQPLVPGPSLILTLDHEVVRGSADPLVERHDAGVKRMIEERVVLSNLKVHQDGVPPETLRAWNAMIAPLRGTSLIQHVTESAGVALLRSELVGGMKPPEQFAKALDAALDGQRHFPFRLPPVPVGVGARWRFREPISLNGARVFQIAEMSLKAVDGSYAVVGIAVRQEAPRQDVPHPLVPGQKAVLEQFRGDGEGEAVLDRLTAVAVKARLIGTHRFTLSGDVAGKHGALTVMGTTSFASSATTLDDDGGGADATLR